MLNFWFYLNLPKNWTECQKYLPFSQTVTYIFSSRWCYRQVTAETVILLFGWQRQEVCSKSEATLVCIKVQAPKSSTASSCPKQTMERKETKNSGNNELFVYCLPVWCAMEGSRGFAVLTMFPFRSRKIPWPKYLRWEMHTNECNGDCDESEKGHLMQIICRPKNLAVIYRLRWNKIRN